MPQCVQWRATVSLKLVLLQTPRPVFCLLLRVSSDYAQPITDQVTEVTCPVIGRAQPELTPSRRQKMGPNLKRSCSDFLKLVGYQYSSSAMVGLPNITSVFSYVRICCVSDRSLIVVLSFADFKMRNTSIFLLFLVCLGQKWWEILPYFYYFLFVLGLKNFLSN